MISSTTGSGNQSGKGRKLKGFLALLLSFVLCASMLPAAVTTALATQEDSAAESGEITLLNGSGSTDGPFDGSTDEMEEPSTPSITYVSVKVSASPEEGGKVSGADTKVYGSGFTVEAAPNTGWHFVEWQRNGAKVSDDTSYTFRAYSNQTLTAIFEKDTYEIDASPNDAVFGSTTGGGTYAHGKEVTLTATANEGHHFVEWQENGAKVNGAGAAYAFIAESDRTLVAVFEVNAPAAEPQERIIQNEITEVPEALKNTPFNTVEKINTELKRVLTNGTGYSAENVDTFDAQLQLSNDGGRTWVGATEENFPATGVTVTLPYPEGTGRDTHEFVVAHMFIVTSDRLGTTAGEMEQPTVTKTPNGVQVNLNGLSPVGIAWKPIDDPTPTPTDNPLDCIPETGDNSNIGLWLCTLAISLAALAVCGVVYCKRRRAR